MWVNKTGVATKNVPQMIRTRKMVLRQDAGTISELFDPIQYL